MGGFEASPEASSDPAAEPLGGASGRSYQRPAEARVLVLSPSYPPAIGGIQLLVHRLVRGWSRVEACVVTSGQGRATRSFDAAEPVEIRRVAGPPKLGHRAAMAALNAGALRAGMTFRPDVILNAHIITSPAAWVVGRASGAAFVQYLHGHEVADRSRLARFALRRAGAAVAVSRHTEALALASGGDPAKVVRIPPGVDLPHGPPHERSSRPIVVTTARLDDRYKGHDVMIAALDLVRQRVPDVVWVAIGDGLLRSEYERLAHRHGLEGNVRFVGALSDDERDAWLDRATVFAMPSRDPPGGGGEGFGIAYLEAAVHGLPVVAGNVGGALDAVLDGQTGALVDPTDEVALAEALVDLLLDRDRAASLGRAGARRAQHFSWSRISRQVEDLLLSLAGDRTLSTTADDRTSPSGPSLSA